MTSMLEYRKRVLRIKLRFEALAPFLNEKQRRLFAAAEATSYGEGGIREIVMALGMSESTIRRGVEELENPESIEPQRVRRTGGGRKRTVDTDPTLRSDLEKLLESTTRGEPQSALRWTCKSTNTLARELKAMGHQTSNWMVHGLLREMGYSLQANRKTQEGSSHPDRNDQFEHVSTQVREFQEKGQPVISVDTKKKELVGDFKNAGQEWRPKGEPESVRTHDFVIPELGKVAPYGVYDIGRNDAWVNVGTDHDTATFAVESIRGWWQSMGKEAYPGATQLLITADGGGSNSSRSRLWKCELQELANETGLSIAVCHFPPGTSKWNKIEHRLFSHITQNWRGRPLINHEVIVNLIANTTTSTGLRVTCNLDTNSYPKGIKVPDDELAQVNIQRDEFHGEWNYIISPITKKVIS
jgi:transposase